MNVERRYIFQINKTKKLKLYVLIAGCSKKIAATLLALKETGFRINELWSCKWQDLDEERTTLKCVAEKHGEPRETKILSRLISMLLDLPKPNDHIFSNSNLNVHRFF